MKIPKKDRLRYVGWRVFPGGWIALGLGALSLTLAFAVTSGPAGLMVALAVAFFAIVAGFAATQWFAKGARYTHEALSVTWHPGTKPNFRPIGDWRQFYHNRWWKGRWSDWARRNGYSREDLHAEGSVELTPDPPSTGWYGNSDIDVDDDEPGIQSYGQHWPSGRHVVVFDEHALGDTMIHELDLLAAEIAAVRDGPIERDGPYDSVEQEKIDWMKKRGIR